MLKKKIKELTIEEKEKIKKAKEELNQYMHNIKYITEKLNDTEELRSILEKVTSVLSPTKNFNAGNKDKFVDALSELEDIERYLDYNINKILEEKFKVDNKIDSVEQPYKNVLFYKYTRGKDWNDVAQELGYTREYICSDLHPKALYLYSKLG